MKNLLAILLTFAMLLSVTAVAEVEETEKPYETANYLYASVRDFEGAFELMKEAAEAGDSEAQTELARYYREGIGVEKDEAAALKWLETAGESGNTEAMYELGDAYLNGKGTDADPTKAIEYFEKAAEGGNAEAMEQLGYCYANGTGVEKDAARATEYYTQAAENGNVNAMRELAFMNYNNGDTVTAQEYFKNAAMLGDAQSQYQLGCIFADGIGVDADAGQAISWWNRAADNGNIEAAVALYKSNHGVETIEPVDDQSDADTVNALQGLLITIGYLKGEPNGKYDSATQEALADFQTSRGLTSTGKADAETIACLDHIDLSPYAAKIELLALRNADDVPELLMNFTDTGDKTITDVTILVIPLDASGEAIARYNENDPISIHHECRIGSGETESTEFTTIMTGCAGVRGIKAAIKRVTFEDGSTPEVPDKMLNWIIYK